MDIKQVKIHVSLQNRKEVNKARSKEIQDRQCTYNVTYKRVRVTTVHVEMQYYILCGAWGSVVVKALRY